MDVLFLCLALRTIWVSSSAHCWWAWDHSPSVYYDSVIVVAIVGMAFLVRHRTIRPRIPCTQLFQGQNKWKSTNTQMYGLSCAGQYVSVCGMVQAIGLLAPANYFFIIYCGKCGERVEFLCSYVGGWEHTSFTQVRSRTRNYLVNTGIFEAQQKVHGCRWVVKPYTITRLGNTVSHELLGELVDSSVHQTARLCRGR